MLSSVMTVCNKSNYCRKCWCGEKWLGLGTQGVQDECASLACAALIVSRRESYEVLQVTVYACVLFLRVDKSSVQALQPVMRAQRRSPCCLYSNKQHCRALG